MLGWFTGLGAAIKFGIILAILAAVVGGGWYIHHTIWKDGYNAATVKLQPIIDKLSADLKNAMSDLTSAVQVNETFAAENKRLSTIVTSQTAAVQKYEAAAIQAQNKARTALNDLQRQYRSNATLKVELARLQAIVDGPPMTEKDCEEADAILRNLVRDRLSVGTIKPAPPADRAGPPTAPDNRKAGAGAVR